MDLKKLFDIGCSDCPGQIFKSKAELERHVIDKHLAGNSSQSLSATKLRLLPLKVRGVKIQHAGKRTKLTPRTLEMGLSEGWLSADKGKVIFHGEDGDVEYKIFRQPGYYCCHCENPLPDAGTMTEYNGKRTTLGLKHIAAAHSGKKSPDPNNVSGYRKDNFYDLRRDSEIKNVSDEEMKKLESKRREALARRLGPRYGREKNG